MSFRMDYLISLFCGLHSGLDLRFYYMRNFVFLLILSIALLPNSWAMSMTMSGETNSDTHDNLVTALHHSQIGGTDKVANYFVLHTDIQVLDHTDCDETQIDCKIKCLSFCSATTALPSFFDTFSSTQFENSLFETPSTGITSRSTAPEIRPPRTHNLQTLS